MKNYKVFWTNEAALDLNEIINYISRDKLSAAIFDDAAMWEPVIKRMKEKKGRLPDVKFISWDKSGSNLKL